MEFKLNSATVIEVRDEWYDAGYHPEDGPGLPYGSNNRQGSVYQIIAEDPNTGARWINEVCFSDGLHIEYSDECQDCGWVFGNPNALAQATDYAAFIQAHVNRGGKLDEKRWTPIQGCYGSAAWDEQAEIDLERRELEEESWYR